MRDANNEYAMEFTAPARSAEHLIDLATRCERGAVRLQHDADHAAEERAAQKRTAADAARTYAQGLRDEAAGLGNGRTSQQRIDQAERVATAAELGGILIDSSRQTEASLRNPFATEAEKQAIEDHAEHKRTTVEAAGVFEHVAEPGQVPFWRLTGPTASARAEMRATDDDTDTWEA